MSRSKKRNPEEEEPEYNFFRFGNPSVSVRQDIEGSNYDPDDEMLDDTVHEFGLDQIIDETQELEPAKEAAKEADKLEKMIEGAEKKKTRNHFWSIQKKPKYKKKGNTNTIM